MLFSTLMKTVAVAASIAASVERLNAAHIVAEVVEMIVPNVVMTYAVIVSRFHFL